MDGHHPKEPTMKNAPGPRGLPIFGNLLDFARTP